MFFSFITFNDTGNLTYSNPLHLKKAYSNATPLKDVNVEIHKGDVISVIGPSGTGKSTQAELWRSLRSAGIINGDRAAIRVLDGVPYACGIPFCGTSDICRNKKLPVKAIVCLDKGTENKLDKLSTINAFMTLNEIKEARRNEHFENLYKSEKASYIMLKKSFDEIEERLTLIGTREYTNVYCKKYECSHISSTSNGLHPHKVKF